MEITLTNLYDQPTVIYNYHEAVIGDNQTPDIPARIEIISVDVDDYDEEFIEQQVLDKLG